MQGSLAERRLPDVLHSIAASEESGILQVSRDWIRKRIYFGRGTMVFANSDLRSDRLGEFLVRQGRMPASKLEEASERVKRTGKRLGEVLVSMGILREEEVRDAVAAQVQGIIYSVFPWEQGTFRFQPHEKPIADELALDLPTMPVILEGVRRIRDVGPIRRALGDLRRKVGYAREPWVFSHHIRLTPEESYVLSRVDGQSTLEEILAISPLGEDETLRCLYGLLAAGFLEIGDKSRDLAPSRRPAGPAAIHAAVATQKKTRSAPAAEEDAPEVEGGEVARKHGALESGTFYDWLEVRRSATAEEIKAAYVFLVKKYHPDRHRGGEADRARLEEIFWKITNAYKILSNPVARRRYDLSLRTEAPRGEESAPVASLEELEERRAAARRAEEQARLCYQKARRYFTSGDYYEAIQLLREALRLEPSRAAYHKLLAQALTKNPNWRKEAEEHFEAALELDPFDVDCLVGLAEIYEQAGLSTRARRLYERALEHDPENEAVRAKLANRYRRWH